MIPLRAVHLDRPHSFHLARFFIPLIIFAPGVRRCPLSDAPLDHLPGLRDEKAPVHVDDHGGAVVHRDGEAQLRVGDKGPGGNKVITLRSGWTDRWRRARILRTGGGIRYHRPLPNVRSISLRKTTAGSAALYTTSSQRSCTCAATSRLSLIPWARPSGSPPIRMDSSAGSSLP